MILLDTNVISALMRQTPELHVVSWLDAQPRTSIWITSITVLELRFGLQSMPIGKRRTNLLRLLETILTDIIEGRIAPFDADAAQQAADLMAARNRAGRPVNLRDTMIAGITVARKASLATRNTSHFDDLPVSVINPWTTRRE